jgi:hypothetical protein
LAWADQMVEIKTICHCGKKATFNVRVSANGLMEETGDQIVLGGNDRYVSVCRSHFRQRMPYRNGVVPRCRNLNADDSPLPRNGNLYGVDKPHCDVPLHTMNGETH